MGCLALLQEAVFIFITDSQNTPSCACLPLFLTRWSDVAPNKCTAAVAAKSLQSCPTLCDPIDGSPPGSPVPGILQARILEWVAIAFSNACMLSCFSRVRLCVTPWTAAHQAPLSTGLSRQEYWSVLPFPSPSVVDCKIGYKYFPHHQVVEPSFHPRIWVSRVTCFGEGDTG